MVKSRKLLILEEEMRRNAIRSYPYFVDKILNHNKQWTIVPFQFETMKIVQQQSEVLALLPRGVGKTEIMITEPLPIWTLIRNPNAKILIRNEVSGNAELYLGAIKNIMEKNELLIALFGEFFSPKSMWTTESIIIAQRNNTGIKEPSISASGLNKSKVGGHYNLIIDDDLVSGQNTQSLEQMQKVVETHKNTEPLQDVTDFKRVIVGTRWHEMDLYNHIMRYNKNFTVIQKKMVEGSIRSGKILFPELFTREKLQSIKDNMGSYTFSCQYLNEPVNDETAVFQTKWIAKMFQPPKREDTTCNTFIAIDPAISLEKHSDYTAMVVADIDPDKRIFIREIIKDKLTLAESIDLIFYLYQKYQPLRIAIEMNAFQKSLKYEIEKEEQRRDIFIPFEGFSMSVNKQNRIRMLQPLLERGDVFCDPKLENADFLEYELLKFPKGEFDDILDALKLLTDVAFSQPKVEKTEDEKREFDMNAFLFSRPDHYEQKEIILDMSKYEEIN